MPSANVVQTSVSGGQQNALALQGDGVFLPKLSTATRTALTLGTSDKGFLAYDTTDNNVYIWNGAAWESIPASGDSSNTQVIFNDNGILAGDAGLTYDKATDALTIGGDLTVDTSTLKVDSANNRVIVGHTSGSSAFQVTNAGAAGIEIQPTGFSSAPLILSYNRSAPAYTQLTLDGSTIVHALSGSTAMTLNSIGLGIGITPLARLHVEQSGPQARFSTASATDARHEYYRNGIREGLIYWDANVIGLYATQATGELVLASSNTIRVRINSAGDTISNVTGTAPALSTNSQMVFNLTSNTNLRISVRGTDGTTRTANITLA